MIAEIDIFGVLVSSALSSALLAWAAHVPLRRLLARTGFYAWTMHRHLVDLSLFILLWGIATTALPALARLLP